MQDIEIFSSTYRNSTNRYGKKDEFSNIGKKIKDGELKIAVYGLGHVGSPIAAVWLRAGAHVIVTDKSSLVLENAKKGRTHVPEPGVNEAFKKGLDENRFEVYEDPVKASRDSFFKMICVPVLTDQTIPINRYRSSDSHTRNSADLTAVTEVTKAISKGLKKGDVVALNPSVPPGTTEEIVLPIIEQTAGCMDNNIVLKNGNKKKVSKKKFQVEKDFYLLYSPERIFEGRAIEDIEQRYPAILSGVGPRSLDIGSQLYSLVFRKGVIKMSSIQSAEAEKLFEGIYRDVNIALANELAKFCEKKGINFWETRAAANSQPYCHIHKPGVGVGGACIPIYPRFIIDIAEKIKMNCDITRLGRITNESMPAYCVKQAVQLLDEKNRKQNTKRTCVMETNHPAKGAIITLLGIAFRGGVSDTRLSPTYMVVDEFKKLKVSEIRIHDPLVKDDPNLSGLGLKYGGPKVKNTEKNTKVVITLTQRLDQAITGADLIMLITDHPQYENLKPRDLHGVPFYDGRGLLDISRFVNYNSFSSIGVGKGIGNI